MHTITAGQAASAINAYIGWPAYTTADLRIAGGDAAPSYAAEHPTDMGVVLVAEYDREAPNFVRVTEQY